MAFVENFVNFANDILWSYILIAMLVGIGIWFSLRTKFVQLRCIKEMVRLLAEHGNADTSKNEVSSFQAFCISAASRVGVGNIAGVVIAVVTGGPGAVFWMWVIAILGSATGFIESTLAQIYKVPRKDGGFSGGPAYYIKNAIGNKFMAGVFAFLICSTFGLVFNSVQANTITLSLQASYGIDRMTAGLFVTALSALVVCGGMSRIAKVAEFMVPIMAGLYLLIAAYTMIVNIDLLPGVFCTIVTSAFDPNAVAGGGIATIMLNGIKRGLFSNEAGMGSVPNAAATASATHPVKQGLLQALGVFVDTLLVCSASAFLVLLCQDYASTGLSGIELMLHALTGHIGSWATGFLSIMIFLFAFSSIVGNYYYGEINMGFINGSKSALWIFRAGVLVMVMFGSVAKVDLVWNLADLFMALMAVTNLVAILILAPKAYAALDDYLAQKRAGILEPVFKRSTLKDTKGIHVWED